MSSTGPRRPGAGGSGAHTGRTRPQPRARATRRAILTAAAEHFACNGYHATSLERVLADSGGTKGALYFHFASKEALARAVIAEMVHRWENLYEQVRTRGLDPLVALLMLVDELIADLIDNPIARGGARLLGDLPVRESHDREHYGVGESHVADLLTQAAQASLLRDGIDPAAVARQVVAIVVGHRQICDVMGDRQYLWQRVDEAWTLLLPAIAIDTWLAAWGVSVRTRPPRHGDISGPENH
jgi:AcrR family transcriptional regulator